MEVEWLLKNNFYKTIERYSNFSVLLKVKNISYIISSLMTLYKFERFQFQTLEKIHSQLPSKDKNYQKSLLWTNLDKHMLKTLWQLRKSKSENQSTFLVAFTALKVVMGSQGTTMQQNITSSSLLLIMLDNNQTEVLKAVIYYIYFRHYYSSS